MGHLHTTQWQWLPTLGKDVSRSSPYGSGLERRAAEALALVSGKRFVGTDSNRVDPAASPSFSGRTVRRNGEKSEPETE